jgi:hypothetical protein
VNYAIFKFYMRVVTKVAYLRSIGIWACISHAYCIRLVMLESGELVFKLSAPDALSTGTVAERIAAL